MNDAPLSLVIEREPDAVFKHDARSTVWRSGGVVVKRYNHARWKQALTLGFGLHPGQCEQRMAARLSGLGVPTVPVVDAVVAGGRVHTATPDTGRSVQVAVASGALRDFGVKRALLPGLATLWRKLVEAGVFFRDFQIANIVSDEDESLYLIDVGGARLNVTEHQRDRMLAMLIRSLRVEGASWTDGLRVLRAAVPGEGWKAVVRRLIEIEPRIAELKPRA